MAVRSRLTLEVDERALALARQRCAGAALPVRHACRWRRKVRFHRCGFHHRQGHA
jgi:hypothetical protein